MIRRRTAQSVSHNGSNGDKLGKKPHSHINSHPKTMVSNVFVASVVIFFITAGCIQHHFRQSRKVDPVLGKPINVASKNLDKKSLLTPEQDAELLIDKKTGLTHHLIFSTDCSPYQHWQSYLVYYSAMAVQQPGHVTRIASGCDPDEAKAMEEWFATDIAFMSTRFHLQLTPHFSNVKNEAGETVGDYKFFNKPFGLKYWLEHSDKLQYSETSGGFPSSVQSDVVILIDPDMGLLRPITADFSNERETLISPRRREHLLATQVSPGHPFAQVYGFGVQWARLDLEKIAGQDTPAAKVSHDDGLLYYPVGPPYLGTVADMHKIALKWTEFVPRVYEQYPHLLAEMFAFCIAAADQELPFQLIDSLMISKTDAGGEGWSLVDQIPAAEMCEFGRHPNHEQYAVPSVVHLCQRYSVGKEWFFSKRKIPSDVYDCETPLFAEPPADLATKYDYKWPWNGSKKEMSPQEVARESFMICYLYGLLNDAATFYKKNACPADNINLEKTRNLVADLQAQKTQKS